MKDITNKVLNGRSNFYIFIFLARFFGNVGVFFHCIEFSESRNTYHLYFFVFILFPTGAVQIIIISIIRPILFLFQVFFLLNFFIFFMSSNGVPSDFSFCLYWRPFFLSSNFCGSSPCCLLFPASCLLSNCSFTFSLFLYFFSLCNEWGSSAPPLSCNIICNRES
jgi:hypothetical protein